MYNISLVKRYLIISILIFSLVITANLPIARAASYTVPGDFPSLADALRNVPDNSIIYLNNIDNITSPIEIVRRRNITIIGGGVTTPNTYNYPYLIMISNSEDITFNNFKIYSHSRPSFTLFTTWLIGIWSIESSLDLYNVDIEVLPLPSAPLHRTMGLRAVNSTININKVNISAYYGIELNDLEFFLRRVVRGAVKFYAFGLYINSIENSFRGFFGYPDNVVNISQFLFRGGFSSNVVLYSGPGIDLNDNIIPGENIILFNNGNIVGSPPSTLGGITALLVRSVDLIMNNINIQGVRDGVSFNMGYLFRRSVIGGDINISLLNSRLYTLNNGFKVLEEALLRNIYIKIENTSFNSSLYGIGQTGFSLDISNVRNRLGWVVEGLNVDLNNVNISGYVNAMFLRLDSIDSKNLWFNRVFVLDRNTTGFIFEGARLFNDVSPLSHSTINDLESLKMKEDFYIAYSIIWNMVLNYRPTFKGDIPSITIFESVVDEHNSFNNGMNPIFIWTLETVALSSTSGRPLAGVSILYDASPVLRVSGYTNLHGSFQYRFYYIFNNSNSFVDLITVSANLFQDNVVLSYVAYINDSYTMPSWYGKIYIYLDANDFIAIGFSHKTGTLLLTIKGRIGYLDSFYSYKPIDPYTPPDLNNIINYGESFKRYYIELRLMVKGGYYLAYYGRMLFEGDWYNIVIIANFQSGLVYLNGPVDLRAMIIG